MIPSTEKQVAIIGNIDHLIELHNKMNVLMVKLKEMLLIRWECGEEDEKCKAVWKELVYRRCYKPGGSRNTVPELKRAMERINAFKEQG